MTIYVSHCFGGNPENIERAKEKVYEVVRTLSNNLKEERICLREK